MTAKESNMNFDDIAEEVARHHWDSPGEVLWEAIRQALKRVSLHYAKVSAKAMQKEALGCVHLSAAHERIGALDHSEIAEKVVPE